MRVSDNEEMCPAHEQNLVSVEDQFTTTADSTGGNYDYVVEMTSNPAYVCTLQSSPQQRNQGSICSTVSCTDTRT